MEQQHTPGPWTAHRRYVETEGQTICEIFGGNRADARLIAAAPDLFEALKSALWRMEQYNYQAMEDTIAKARAAIAKATGEK